MYPRLVHTSSRSPLRGADGEGRGDGTATEPRVGGERARASSPPRRRGPALPSGPPHPAPGASLSPRDCPIAPRRLSAYLGVELSPFQGCPLAAKPSSAASGARPLGAPAPCSPAPHRLSAEAPRRPLACGAERRGRETRPGDAAAAARCRPPAAKGAAAVAKGAVSGSAESGGRAGPGQHGDVAAHKRPGESGREVRAAPLPGKTPRQGPSARSSVRPQPSRSPFACALCTRGTQELHSEANGKSPSKPASTASDKCLHISAVP
ncbi:translation initiation factor IF-2-like [Vidua macroura]|uniref:translation initiation factor IF-2-like n=1 Tax=Vidua macroura TaxID=187451 RepID=UPI0023A8BA01|nr:translation initiation factor IF-2-like [Vidua macroura]